MLRSKAVVICIALWAISSPAAARQSGYAPRVGMRHADFTLPRIEDRAAVSLSDLRGKKVLLIHFASW
ncbi:MAG: hypothetical protein SFX72_17235 [Isosphaeraceae bacterium]|nr:hypothetical protein [Isosphaeraceae bacterium]